MILELTSVGNGSTLYVAASSITCVCLPGDDAPSNAESEVWQGNDEAARLLVLETVGEVVMMWRCALGDSLAPRAEGVRAEVWTVVDVAGMS